ncbi:hypothetical protein GCM10010961_35840 [Pseudodonghicola xiamenensis]|uniref:Uncharacterized protein n=1 Tax=Pseudodonghicola xiamenensis TaxID=337702 RepID=A0A8J3HB86_9RHOB|nr:hypothetical protein GCM10010961_35840 [Pseudodonghicola xiamenensis]
MDQFSSERAEPWGNDGGSASIRNGIMALARVAGAVCGDATDLLSGWDLIEQFRQHGGTADATAGELDSSDLQRLLVDPEEDFAPNPRFGTGMLARIPLAFTLDLDASAVHCAAVHCEAMSREGISRCKGPLEP